MSWVDEELLFPPLLDYQRIFDAMPGMCLILDPKFNIIAQNAEHAKATLSTGKEVIGKFLFEIFPDNPGDSNADGVAQVRQSLIRVMETLKQDVIPIIRYDVKPKFGEYDERYWAITNTPILGPDGFVQWIINRADDVTELVRLRNIRRVIP